MKTLRAQYQRFVTSVIVKDAQGKGTHHSIRFNDFVATVEDAVADAALALNASFFSIDKVDALDVGGSGKTAQSVLILREQGVGDVMMATCLARHLKRKGVETVGFATFERHTPLLANNPCIDEVFATDTLKAEIVQKNGSPYEVRVDLRMYVENLENSGQHRNRILAFCEAASVSPAVDGADDLRLTYVVTQGEQKAAQQRLDGFFGYADLVTTRRNRYAVVWRSSTRNRNLSEGKLLSIIEELRRQDDGCEVVILDHECQGLGRLSGLPRLFNATGKFGLRESIALMNECDVVLCPDTGMFHVASALGKPIVSYFGPFPLAERWSGVGIALSMVSAARCALWPCRKYYCLNMDAEGSPRCFDADASEYAAKVISARENPQEKN